MVRLRTTIECPVDGCAVMVPVDLVRAPVQVRPEAFVTFEVQTADVELHVMAEHS